MTKTAPISNIANATTPMLIQHGSDDQRVPLSNAMELYRGLKEMERAGRTLRLSRLRPSDHEAA